MNQIWRKILPLLLLSVLVCKSNCESDRSAKGLLVNRTGAIVKINSQCIPNDGIGIGTCMRRRDCIKDNGNVTGTCDKGQICCKTTVEKCINVAAKRFNLVRPPSKSLTDCTYTISAFSSRVCQLKIEFTELTLAAPEIDSNGTMECRREVLLIDDVAMDFCGNNDNQHVFVEFDAKSKSKKELKFKLDPKEESQWYLSVTQLECPLDPSPISRWQPIRTALSYFHFGRTGGSLISSLQHSSNVGDIHELAPAGCLQYFTEPKGVVSSFNYVDGMYLPDMDYAICIKRKPANKQLSMMFDEFSLGAELNNTNGDVDNNCFVPTSTEARREDYLLIPRTSYVRPESATPIRNSFFCGMSLDGASAVTASSVGPFVMVFHSDNIFAPDQDVGFAFNYDVV